MRSVFDHEAPRVGRFRLSSEFLSFENEGLALVMSSLIVTDCRHSLADKTVEYTAYSLAFDPVDQGDQVPEYVAVISMNDRCVPKLRLEWQRVGS